MKNIKGNTTLIFTVLFMIFSAIFISATAFADTYENIQPTSDNVSVNKSWTIHFNMELNSTSVNTDNFLVVDENQEKVNVNVNVGQDNKSVIVSPVNNYTAGKTYNLIINKNVQAVSGKILGTSKRMRFSVATVAQKNLKVCIDPGHGGSDTGIVGTYGTRESDVDLSVALKAGKMLQDSGVQVFYTRTTDTNVDMSSRFNASNSNNVDYFISIHCNASTTNSTASGVECYYSASSTPGKNLAASIQNEISSLTGLSSRYNGNNNADINNTYPEVNSTNAPGVKLYLGFLSTPSEENILKSDDFQSKSAKAIFDSIMPLAPTNSDAKIVSINDVQDTVNRGAQYTLPSKVTALMSDNTQKTVDVSWQGSINTASSGTYSIYGTVSGYSKNVKLTVTVKDTVVVCLDPGHGGYDSGAVGPSGIEEKNITLPIVLKIGNILSQNGVQVVYTRTSDNVSWPSDVSADLQERCDISNAANANCFVAIHANSCDTPSVNGIETYYSDGSTKGQALASLIQNNLISATGLNDRHVQPDTNLYHSGLYVLEHTNAPAVLTEVGFISNPQDEELLNTSSYQDKLAGAIAQGILTFIKE